MSIGELAAALGHEGVVQGRVSQPNSAEVRVHGAKVDAETQGNLGVAHGSSGRQTRASATRSWPKGNSARIR